MSKTPQEKKQLSLARDSRNSFGQNAKASRKLIPRLKQKSQQAKRRAVGATLRNALGSTDVATQEEADVSARSKEIRLKRSAFQKQADISLGTSLSRKATTSTASYKNFGRRPI